MKKILRTENVGLVQNAHAQHVIQTYINSGWGIDAMVFHPDSKDTWVTFFKYEP